MREPFTGGALDELTSRYPTAKTLFYAAVNLNVVYLRQKVCFFESVVTKQQYAEHMNIEIATLPKGKSTVWTEYALSDSNLLIPLSFANGTRHISFELPARLVQASTTFIASIYGIDILVKVAKTT